MYRVAHNKNHIRAEAASTHSFAAQDLASVIRQGITLLRIAAVVLVVFIKLQLRERFDRARDETRRI